MATISLQLTDEQRALENGVTEICKRYPGEYWRELDARREYPEKFVDELTRAGYLAALIPQEYGGAGLPLRDGALILETIHASGGSAGACHAQMYIMGTVLRHGSEAQKEQVPAEDRLGGAPPAGVRRDRARRRLRHHPAEDRGRSAKATATSSTAARSSSRARCSPT